ncbi:hypothetical protein Q91_0513 [Cycloclasticus sp. P1]|uniref:Uncharacterized protein n=1 Tax=Cycloclasticus pugetii TaxID=34068 RepID=A0AB33Z4E6_9GAMM|nr:hypothetical protein Q91_0513 [Cycloclasticus sp. P1]EPD14309.1 hypothetical protein L196_02390 [Cycloclasticus pugetii]
MDLYSLVDDSYQKIQKSPKQLSLLGLLSVFNKTDNLKRVVA